MGLTEGIAISVLALLSLSWCSSSRRALSLYGTPKSLASHIARSEAHSPYDVSNGSRHECDHITTGPVVSPRAKPRIQCRDNTYIHSELVTTLTDLLSTSSCLFENVFLYGVHNDVLIVSPVGIVCIKLDAHQGLLYTRPYPQDYVFYLHGQPTYITHSCILQRHEHRMIRKALYLPNVKLRVFSFYLSYNGTQWGGNEKDKRHVFTLPALREAVDEILLSSRTVYTSTELNLIINKVIESVNTLDYKTQNLNTRRY